MYISLLLMLLSTSVAMYAQTDTVHNEKRLIDELTSPPLFNGNVYKFLSRNIRYPHLAKDNGITGTVYVRFLIDENGNVTDPALALMSRKLGGGLDEEALRVVKTMPAWQPATYNGKAVRVVYTLPVKFRLE